MIVRDEEKMLPRFIEHAKGLWDELCVVDTGSQDRSMDLIKAAGGRIEQHPWKDDFSAARNASLEMATGDWIIFLDADEMVSPELKEQLRQIISKPNAGAATLVMRNRMEHGHYHDTNLLRIFRNDARIRFRYPIHEDIATSVNEYLRKTGKELLQLDAVVEHLGYVRSVAAEKDKKNRDLQLLEVCLRQDPNDFYSYFKLLELARFWSDAQLLRSVAERAHEQLERVGKNGLSGFDYTGEFIALLAEGKFQGEFPQMLQFLNRWPQEHSAAYLLKRAELHELLGDFPAAEKDFLACLKVGRDRLQQLVTVRPYLGLTRLAIARGDYRAALKYVLKGLEFAPRDPEALLAAVALHRVPEIGSLQQFVSDYRRCYGDAPELNQAIGEEAFMRRDFQTAATALQKVSGDSRSATLYAQSLLALGKIDEALDQANRLLTNYPEAAAGVIICTLLKNQDIALDVDIEMDVLERALKSWIEVLISSPHPEILNHFEQMAPAIAHVFPWLESHLKKKTDLSKKI
jgi:glycosyltransferase involved in cell wall biosynthesis